MVNISKQHLNEKVEYKLFIQFSKIFSSPKGSGSGKLFASLFSEKEHIMFVKRLAIILLLAEGYPKKMIAKLLAVSRTTVVDISQEYERGRYNAIVYTTERRKKDREEMWETINVVLRLGMPSMGKDRWKWLKTRPQKYD